MGQVTIYLDDETKRRMQFAAKSAGLSQSKWIAKLIHDKTTQSWPENIVQLAGAWRDMPTAEEIREGFGKDIKKNQPVRRRVP